MNIDGEKLLNLVKKKPCIYDYSLPQHSDKLFVDKTWDAIAKEIKCPVSVCKAKWANLRVTYSKYRRVGSITPNGTKRRKWYLADAMSFLDKHSIQQPDQRKVPDTATKTKHKQNQNTDLSPAASEIEDDCISSAYQSSCRSKTEPSIKFVRLENKPKIIEDNPDSMFFKSMLAQYKKLTQKRKRTFRELMVTKLNRLQEEDEIDQPHVCYCHRDSLTDDKP